MELPHLGTHCSNRDCNRLDFLPVKCDGCQQIFCSTHMSYSSHNCPTPKVMDNQVPVCPLCGEPVPCKRGDPPDIAVSEHIDRDCRSPAVKAQIYPHKCSLKSCKKKELLPFECANCQSNFCIQHRHPMDHKCSGKPIKKKKNERQQPANTNRNVDFSQFQGSMTEDEALARAFAMSISPVISGSSRSTSRSLNDNDTCAMS